jgi:peptidoglycan/xylan/chitin deacetylase (PgdA/CDA1 family)
VIGKKIIGKVLGHPVIARLGQRLNRVRPLVLLYHGVTDQIKFLPVQNYHGKQVPFDAFHRQLKWLKKYFTVVPLAEIEKLVVNQQLADQPLCAITFDDGYRNNFLQAFPVLKAENIPATFFLTGNFVDQQIPLWTDRLEFCLANDTIAYAKIRQELKSCSEAEKQRQLAELEITTGRKLDLTDHSAYAPINWNEAKIMADSGMTFGAHTMTHPILGRLNYEEQEREIINSKILIESKLGRCPHFAYPNGQSGDWDNQTLAIVQNAGWKAAWSTIPQRVNPQQDEPLTLPRITIAAYHDDHRFRTLVSGLIPR